jgi:hypothetical protein
LDGEIFGAYVFREEHGDIGVAKAGCPEGIDG